MRRAACIIGGVVLLMRVHRCFAGMVSWGALLGPVRCAWRWQRCDWASWLDGSRFSACALVDDTMPPWDREPGGSMLGPTIVVVIGRNDFFAER